MKNQLERLSLLTLAVGFTLLGGACSGKGGAGTDSAPGGGSTGGDSGITSGTDGGAGSGTDSTTDSGTDTSTDSGTGTDTGPVTNPDTVSLTEHGLVTCADPSAREVIPFYNFDLGADWQTQDYDRPIWEDIGGGITVADLNGDGRLDVYLPQWLSDQIFISQEDGTLADETALRYPKGLVSGTTTATAVDYDGDADLDLYLCNGEGGDSLLQNDGLGYFTDVTEAAGLVAYERRCTGSAWGDIDGDGDLDAFISTYISCERHDSTGPNYCVTDDPSTIKENRNLLLNNGDGTFSDVTVERGLPSELLKEAMMHTSGMFDVDMDGDMDLYLVNDNRPDVAWQTPTALLYLNDGTGNFTQAEDTSGIQIQMSGMGLGIGDINGDELPDMMISDLGRMWMFESISENVWVDSTISHGLQIPPDVDGLSTGWGTQLADIENDGDLDGVMVFGRFTYGTVYDDDEKDRIFLQDDEGKFSDTAAAWGVADSGLGRGLVTIDYNGDGYLDLFKPQIGDQAHYYQSNCGAAGWLDVDLHGPSPNPFGVGAVIRAKAGDQHWIRWILAGSTAIATSYQPQAHFGFGDVDILDELSVTWPDGEVSVFYDVDTRQRVTVERSE